jgi:uncharacterized RDD family membrane protein YckC
MKCPKCAYIGFEAADRCKNCGYDFSLVPTPQDDQELPLRADEALGPMSDFDLGPASRPPAPTPNAKARRRHDPAFDPGIDSAEPAKPTGAEPVLPLFGELETEEQLPVVRPASPVPLAVRRGAPPLVKARPRPTPRPPEDEPEPLLPIEQGRETAGDAVLPSSSDAPGLGRRAAAGALDAALLAGLDALVVYFTMRVCRLDMSEWTILPWPPVVAFLLFIDLGYLALMTAVSGQTVGKIALHLKVVSGDASPVTTGQAVARALFLAVGAAPVGLGLLPACFDRARRGLHDRLARTRVVNF